MSGPDQSVEVSRPTAQEVQLRYHHERFHRLVEPKAIAEVIDDLSGTLAAPGWLGLDQMGHFGPNGCERAADCILAEGAEVGILVELGSGYGGALRDIVDRLARAGRAVGLAVGVELVAEHCVAAQTISVDLVGLPTAFVAGDAAAVPLGEAVADVVVIVGSMPHFAEPKLVLLEAARLLRDDGILVLFEEVSLVPADVPEASADFIATHPAGVFHRSTVADRLAALERAGFEVEVEDIAVWAQELLVARLRALRLLRGTAERVYGDDEVTMIERTLESAIGELVHGRLTPRLIIGHRRTRP